MVTRMAVFKRGERLVKRVRHLDIGVGMAVNVAEIDFILIFRISAEKLIGITDGL